MPNLETDHLRLLAMLASRGLVSSIDVQDYLGKSQPTASRLLNDLVGQVLTLGQGRRTRYGAPKSIHGMAAQQPLWWVDEGGQTHRVGDLSHLAGGRLHIKLDAREDTLQGSLPWYMTPLRAQGFLGRLLARHLAPQGLLDNPEQWPLESVLFAATQLHDVPGALLLGERPPAPPLLRLPRLPLQSPALHAALDTLAQEVARTFPAGSSAGGEQPKFLAMLESGQHVLVKFSPPRGTPFGERWHDLLHAEALSAAVLAEHGVPAARCSALRTATRSYLVSERFDRIGAAGRRHVVSVGAAHEGLLGGPYTHWAASCEALAKRRWLEPAAAATARRALAFGRLIGNTDMHSGNLSLYVERAALGRRRFTGGLQLAPLYDMLPMRWRPNPEMGGAADYTPFEPDATSLGSAAQEIGRAHV